MIHWRWGSKAFSTPSSFSLSSFSLSPCHTISTSSLSHTLLPPSPHHLSFFSLSLPYVLLFFTPSFGQDVVLYNQASHWTGSFLLCGQLIHPETGCSWGRQEWARKLWRVGWEKEGEILLCCGLSTKVRAGCARLVWVCLHEKRFSSMTFKPCEYGKKSTLKKIPTCDYVMWNSRTVFLPPYTSPPPQPASTHSHTWRCWVYCGPGIAVLAESAERGKEKQRGEEQKKKKKKKKKKTKAIDRKNCIKTVTAQREKREAWREGWRGYFTGVEKPFQRQRKTGDWNRGETSVRGGLWLRE